MGNVQQKAGWVEDKEKEDRKRSGTHSRHTNALVILKILNRN